MAKSNNIITRGMSGMIGDMLVFRQRGGKTFVSKAPKHSNQPPTVQQQQTRATFQQAIIYGKAAIADKDTKAAYNAAAKEGQTAFNVAVADFFHAPDITDVDISDYTGVIGDHIRIWVTDDFQVAGVYVKIENPDNTLVEEGAAVAGADGLHWIYTATAVNASLTGDKITITATDTPEHSSVHTKTI